MNKEDIKVNGYPINFLLELVTEPGEGWVGSQLLGCYESTDALNQAINHWKDKCPVGWGLEVSFTEKPL